MNENSNCRKLWCVVLAVTVFLSHSFGGLALAGEKASEAVAEKTAAVTEVPAKVEEAAPQKTLGSVEASPSQVKEEVKAPESPVLESGYVTVNFKGADIRTVLAYISEVAGVDIVSAPDVKGIIDLKLTNKPWLAALDIIVRNYGFAYEREGDIIRVVTLDKLKQEELATQAFALNYSKSKEVVAALKNIVGPRGSVVFDDRTNTVLVTDIPTNLYRIGQIISRLDKKTEQVLIEARIIETVLGDDEKLGIDWNVKVSANGASRPTTLPFEFFKTPFESKSGEGKQFFPQVLTAAPETSTLSPGGQTTITTAGEFPASATGYFGFPFAPVSAFSYGTLDFSQFKAVLELLKQRSDTDTISNPRIATLNNNKATINVGDVLNFPKFERNSTTGKMEITGYEEKNSGIILNVTPHINGNSEIAIELVPEITEFIGSQPIAPGSEIYAPLFRSRQANTQVMINDGQTIFIGGLITDKNFEGKTKLPFIGDLLGDVPGIGLLVSKKNIEKKRVELIFFITVHIMTAGKEIKGVPLPDKAYIPVYSDTQQGNKASNKKRLKKTN